MKNVAVVVDSFSCKTIEEAKKLELYFLSLITKIDDVEYISGVESYEFIIKKLKNSNTSSTSQPGIKATTELFSKLSKEYKNVFYVSIGSGLSSTASTSIVVANDFDNVHVIDNHFVGSAIIKAANLIKEMANEGKTPEEIIERIKWYDDKIISYVIPKDVTAINKSGRISNAKKAILNKLKIVPILEYSKLVKSKGFRRTQNKAISKAVLDLFNFIQNNKFNIKDLEFETVHSNYMPAVKHLESEVKKVFKAKLNKILSSPMILVHTGIGSLCITAFPKKWKY
ncbi:MAG: DegV family protein [Mycoplasma sp.]|nr:DegV family protein [Mycoplasma sp.]